MDDIRPVRPNNQPSQPVQDFVQPVNASQAPNTSEQQPPQPVATPADGQEIGVPNSEYNEQHAALNRQIGKKRKGLVFVIVLAVLITLGLIGAAGYMYWQSLNEQPEAPAVTETESTTVDENTIDEVSNKIDEVVEELETNQGLQEADLSDDTLEL